jgi:hypothetical protein
MESSNVPAQAGWDWLQSGLGRLARQPLAALAAGAVLALAALVPVVGGWLSAALLAPVYGALLRLLAHPRALPPGRWPGWLRAQAGWRDLALLSAVPLATMLAMTLAMWLFLGSAGLGGDVAGGNLALAQLGLGTLLLPIFALAAFAVMVMALFFSVPLVALRGQDARSALVLGWATAKANVPALLLLVLVLVVAALVIAVPLQLLGAGAARVGVSVVLHPLLAAAMAAGYAEVFAGQRA